MSPDELSPTPHDLEGLVQYQAGSIVSRTLIKRDAGTITLFAFDAGQELSEHTTPYQAMVSILDGEAEVSVSGTPMNAKRGQMVIMPANVPHALRATHRFKMMLTMIRD